MKEGNFYIYLREDDEHPFRAEDEIFNMENFEVYQESDPYEVVGTRYFREPFLIEDVGIPTDFSLRKKEFGIEEIKHFNAKETKVRTFLEVEKQEPLEKVKKLKEVWGSMCKPNLIVVGDIPDAAQW